MICFHAATPLAIAAAIFAASYAITPFSPLRWLIRRLLADIDYIFID